MTQLIVKEVFYCWKEGLLIKLSCLCSRMAQTFFEIGATCPEKTEKEAVIFPFAQKVENRTGPINSPAGGVMRAHQACPY